MYVKVPFALDFRIYMFNLTNRDEVHKGSSIFVCVDKLVFFSFIRLTTSLSFHYSMCFHKVNYH